MTRASYHNRTPSPQLGLLLFCLGLGLAALPVAGGARPTARSPEAGEVRVTILVTTDVHGNVWPYDYLRAQAASRGLAKVSSYVKQVRGRQPNTLLVDCGDTFQGTPLAYFSVQQGAARPNPVVAAMNAMGYDAMATGNHEWNFGLPTLWRLKEEARFPILGANVVSSYHDRLRDFPPYVIRTVGGVRVAFLGLVTPSIRRWDLPEHWVGYEFRDLVETAQEYLPRLRQKADVVILLVHSGLGRDPKSFEPVEELFPEENRVWELAEQVPGIDAILFGHSHQTLAGKRVNGVLLVQPKNWAQSVAEVELVLQPTAGSGARKAGWQLIRKQSRLVSMDDSIEPDPEILELTREAHQQTERWLSTVLAESGRELSGRTARVEDTALVDLIHRAQLQATEADVSLAGIFSTRTKWPAGPLTIRHVYSLYFYENKLLTVEVHGSQLKEALEYAARSYRSYPWPAGSSPFSSAPYALEPDSLEGVTYKIDLSKPVGERVVDLALQGAPLAPDRKLRLALNSYRWSGGGGFTMLRPARILARSDKEVREVIIDYLRAQQTFDPVVSENWELLPPEARREALEWVGKPSTASVPVEHWWAAESATTAPAPIH